MSSEIRPLCHKMKNFQKNHGSVFIFSRKLATQMAATIPPMAATPTTRTRSSSSTPYQTTKGPATLAAAFRSSRAWPRSTGRTTPPRSFRWPWLRRWFARWSSASSRASWWRGAAPARETTTTRITCLILISEFFNGRKLTAPKVTRFDENPLLWQIFKNLLKYI